MFLYAIVALSVCVMASCGKKSSKDKDEKDDTELVENEEEDDEELSEADEEVADGVDVAPDEDWTEESVVKVIRQAYADVNVIFGPREEDLEPNIDLFAMYCTKDFNNLVNKVRAIDNEKDDNDDMFFTYPDLTWNYWGEGSVEPKDIKVDLLTGNMAEASFQLTHGQEWLQTKLSFFYEDGQWRIEDWLQVGDNEMSLVKRMTRYVEQNQ